MPGLDETLHKLAEYRKRFEDLFPAASRRSEAKARPSRDSQKLVETDAFGANPGNLRMFSFVPDLLPPKAPLVVVLHGCTQTAASYDNGAGWSDLAARFGFAVLIPEQQRANNPNLCFNWFVPRHTARDEGEVASIRQMIDHMVTEHGLDPARIAITGLSAGGAMAAAMLACYPELFAHGAIIAGLPYGAAGNVQEALGAMFQGVGKSGEDWADLVRSASPHQGPWPKVSVWHGSADATVRPSNAGETVKQWIALHGLPEEHSHEKAGPGFTHRVWQGRDGSTLLEAYDIAGMAHGTPIAPNAVEPQERCGAAGPYMLDVGISSTYLIAQSWGLVGETARAPAAARAAVPSAGDPHKRRERSANPSARGASRPRYANSPVDPGAVIAKALRAAGLIK
ncbi:MAG TPA: PHB depolymerase family esterase [Aliidongia sp.]|nr:PHB depolymerase family esterase [Aliidongia sp.]